MSRLQLRNRTIETKDVNLGKIILFCEGLSEKYYFDYFAQIINSKPNKYNNVIVQTQDVGGNAQAVVNYANDFLNNESNNREYSKYGKYLIFDCDAPENIQEVINEAMTCQNNYKLLISNHFFETWLLIHFEDVDARLSKKKTYEFLSSHLSSHYRKAKRGIIREILSNGDVGKAIQFAKRQDNNYHDSGLSIQANITDMNPFSNVYLLVEELLTLIS